MLATGGAGYVGSALGRFTGFARDKALCEGVLDEARAPAIVSGISTSQRLDQALNLISHPENH